MDANTGMYPIDEKGEKLTGDTLSSIDETIDWVVNNYSIGDESPEEAETELSVTENMLPTDTPISKLPKGNGGSSEDENNAKPMNEEEKMQLSRGIAKVYGPRLMCVIDMIKSREPSERNSGNFVLNIHKLQPSTLRALETYVASCIGEKHYYKKIAITREQRADVRRKRKLRRLKKQLQEVTEVSSNKSHHVVAESSWYSDSISSDSYGSFSTNTTDSEADLRSPDEMFDTKREPHSTKEDSLHPDDG